jgi:hypothetical protein
MRSTKFEQVYQFRVTLKGVTPAVWRQIQVPENYALWDLHVAIQNAMGWDDSHLHLFKIANPKTGEREEFGIPDEESFLGDPCIADWEVTMRSRFTREQDAAEYEYDFGDSWEHTVVLEKILPREKNEWYARHVRRPPCSNGVAGAG